MHPRKSRRNELLETPSELPFRRLFGNVSGKDGKAGARVQPRRISAVRFRYTDDVFTFQAGIAVFLKNATPHMCNEVFNPILGRHDAAA